MTDKIDDKWSLYTDTIAMENMKEEFIQCLEILYYDYGLYKQYTKNNNDKNKNKTKNTNVNTNINTSKNNNTSRNNK